MRDYYPIVIQAVLKLDPNTADVRNVFFGQLRRIFLDELRLRQPAASDAEIKREYDSLETAIRTVESELSSSAKSHAIEQSTPRSELPRSAPSHSKQLAPPSSPTPQMRRGLGEHVQTAPRGRHLATGKSAAPRIEIVPESLVGSSRTAPLPVDFATGSATTLEHEDGKIHNNLHGLKLLDQLMLDAAHPFASDDLFQDAREALNWLGVDASGTIQLAHYTDFGSAIGKFMLEVSDCASMPADSPGRRLTEEMRGVINRLLDREQAALALNGVLSWFAGLWVTVIIGLNAMAIIAFLAVEPNFLVALREALHIYSPLNAYTWFVEAVALSPAVAIVAGRDRRLRRWWVLVQSAIEWRLTHFVPAIAVAQIKMWRALYPLTKGNW